MQKTYNKFVAIIGSKQFFWVIVILFILQAAWFALSARFPMAFDEAYHLANIQIYSHQYSPFFNKQPAGPLTYGPLVHNTSFLYHYLMSYPYRLIRMHTYNLKIQVTILRFIDIALFTWSLVIFRRILLKLKDEPAVANLSILVFTLIPIVPFLAGQINYDNLGIPLIALSILWSIKFVEQLRKKQQINLPLLFGALIVVTLASMVSYLFLPFFASITLYLSYVVFRFGHANTKKFKNAVKYSIHKTSRIKKALIVIVFAISVVLFIESYGINIVKFHNPIPQCNQLLSSELCSTYAPWNRNNIAAHSNVHVDINPIRYTASWLDGMYERMVFTINGPSGSEGYANPQPLPILNYSLIFFVGFGIILFLKYGLDLIKKNPYLKFILFIDFVFVISLWGRNYHDYINLKQLIAINGRYLLPITIPIIFIIGLCYKKLLSNHHLLIIGTTFIVLICLLQGGGVLSFINASDDNWYWTSSPIIIHINNDSHNFIKPLLIQ